MYRRNLSRSLPQVLPTRQVGCLQALPGELGVLSHLRWVRARYSRHSHQRTLSAFTPKSHRSGFSPHEQTYLLAEGMQQMRR